LQAPKVDEAVSSGTKRKIGKLWEYLQKNPGKCAKVSRRLTRRIKKALYDQQLGYVNIAVHAYNVLLSKSMDDESSYSFEYFSKELVQEPDTVIKALLSYHKMEVQALGAELLAHYIQPQDNVANQADTVAQLTQIVVKLLQKANESKEAGVQAFKASCLQSIKEYVMFCHRLKVLPTFLEDIEASILDNVDWSTFDAGLEKQGSAARGVDASATVGPGSAPATASELAFSTLQEFHPFLQDISTVYRVLETLLRYLDKNNNWDRPKVVETLIGLIQKACGEQTFPLFTALMRHTSSPALTAQQRATVMKLAIKQGSVYSLSALSLALTELPKALVAAAQKDEPAKVKGTALEVVQHLSKEVGDAAQLCEAVGGSLRSYAGQPATTDQTLAALECSLASVQAISEFKDYGRSFPAKSFPGILLQQLGAFIIGVGPEDARQLQAMQTAKAILGGIVPCASEVRDERQAYALLVLAQELVLGPSAVPSDAALSATIVKLVVASKRPVVLLQAARVAITLRQECLEGPAPPVQACAGLVLLDSLLHHLAAAASCPPLLQLQHAAALHKKLVVSSGHPGLSERGQGSITVSAAQYDTRAETVSRAREVLKEAASVCASGTWNAQMAAALAAESMLKQEYREGLKALVLEPLALKDLAGSAGLPTSVAAQVVPSPGGTRSISGSGVNNTVAQVFTQAHMLSQRVAASSWSARQASLKRERLNLERVLDIIEDDDAKSDEVEVKPDAAASSQPSGGATSPGGLSTVRDVLDMMAALPKQKGAEVLTSQMTVLAAQLEPIVH